MWEEAAPAAGAGEKKRFLFQSEEKNTLPETKRPPPSLAGRLSQEVAARLPPVSEGNTRTERAPPRTHTPTMSAAPPPKLTRIVDLRPSLQPVTVQFIVLDKGV